MRLPGTWRLRLTPPQRSKPDPGSPGLHRLNRTEYANAVRDLLALEVDPAAMLPADDSSEGFDNIADALAISPALVERYAAAAAKISRLAVGNHFDQRLPPSPIASRATCRRPQHIDGLPLGTRGGIVIRHTFPLDAEYSIKVRGRSAGIGVGGAGASGEELEVALNGERVKISPSGSADLQIAVKAGPQNIGAAFVRKSPPGADDIWGTYAGSSSVQSIAITGPLHPTGVGDTPSRRRIFVCLPASESEEADCARKILSTLARRGYRQPPSAEDMDTLLSFFANGRQGGNFDTGMEAAVARVLADPRFVFRFEREPAGVPAGTPYRISDLELASRLSFFLWSSLPDDELLEQAMQGKLHEPADARTGNPAHAGGSEVGVAGHQLCRPVAVSSRVEESPAPRRPSSTTICGRPFVRRPRCCWKASCARIAASWIC